MIKRTRSRSSTLATNSAASVSPSRASQKASGGSHNSVVQHEERGEIRLKNRSYYQQFLDKYTNLANEATRSGDRIDAEVYWQYAEHYFRQLNERIRYDIEQQNLHQQSKQARYREHEKSQVQKEVSRPHKRVQHNIPDENSTTEASSVVSKNNTTHTEVDGQQGGNTQPQTRRKGPRGLFKKNRSSYTQEVGANNSVSNSSGASIA